MHLLPTNTAPHLDAGADHQLTIGHRAGLVLPMYEPCLVTKDDAPEDKVMRKAQGESRSTIL